MIIQHGIRQVVFTGTTTDPQLYRHEARLLEFLRSQLPPGTQFALHTNGRLALKKMDTFNLYDRVCISFPTFNRRYLREADGRARRARSGRDPRSGADSRESLVPHQRSLTSPKYPIFWHTASGLG